MTPFGIAGIQMNLRHGNNVDAIGEKIDLLMCLYPWVEMVIVSELAAHGPLDNFAETMPGLTEDQFCAMAKKHNIWLIPGSFFELRNNATFNTAPVINPQGEVIARHRKLFPFCPFEEGIEAGDEFVVFDVPGAGRFGLCICYDMWFPEVLRTLTSMGAEVILHPVLTGTNDRDIELNLARSSGALFQSYIIDINGLGVGGIGQSCIIDPAGRVVYQAGATDEFLVTELDFDNVRRQREVGLRNLGQPLKSFRDTKIDFTVYNKTQRNNAYLASLGPLQKTNRESKNNMATEPALLINHDSVSNGKYNSETLNTGIITPDAAISEIVSADIASPATSIAPDYPCNEVSMTPDITEYKTVSLDTPVDIPSTIVEAHALAGYQALIDPKTMPNSTTTADEIVDVSAITTITEAVDDEVEIKIETVRDKKVASDDLPKGDNLKWLKEASTQIKQYIKS